MGLTMIWLCAALIVNVVAGTLLSVRCHYTGNHLNVPAPSLTGRNSEQPRSSKFCRLPCSTTRCLPVVLVLTLDAARNQR